MRLLLFIAFGLMAALAQAADPVGRIFFTPEQRSQLDTLRQQKAVASQVRDEPIPETITYNGIVRRSDGKTTVWVNDEALSEAGLLNKQSMVGRVGRDGQIRLQATQAAGTLQLKVGQSAELLSGRVGEAYAMPRAAPAARTAQQAKPEAANKTGAPAQTPPPAANSANETPDPEAPRKAAPQR